MERLEQDIGFEMLGQTSMVKVSRFTRRIRILHWFNAGCILSLYALGISQLFKLSQISFYNLEDLRPLHIQIGIIWVVGVVSLGIIAKYRTPIMRDVIVTDKLVIKQRIFLITSIILMMLMALTGLGMYFLRPHGVPEIRSILLTLHGLIAFTYLPVLCYHLYLAVIHRESRQSLRTMVSDVYLKYLVHNHIPNLRCWLTDAESVLFVSGCVTEVSLIGFHVKIKSGRWQKKVPLKELIYVEMLHPDIGETLRLKTNIVCHHEDDGEICAEFKFRMSLQESARVLLSRAVFFRALFLARRTHPRLSCNYPVEVSAKNVRSIGQMVDLCEGGLGVMVPLNLRKGGNIDITIDLKNPKLSLEVSGRIVVKEIVSEGDWCYGLSFRHLKRRQKQQILELLTHIRVQRRLREMKVDTSIDKIKPSQI